MRIVATEIPGVMELLAEPRPDARGFTLKTFEENVFAQAGLPIRFAEALHTYSKRGVIRGMHFQTPPSIQGKAVYCVHGGVFDVVLDLRFGSPSYLRFITRELSRQAGNGLYVPEGCAHGFCVLGDEAVVAYLLTTSFVAGNDAGVLWNSFGVEWPVTGPNLSDRDQVLIPLADFVSPFEYEDPACA